MGAFSPDPPPFFWDVRVPLTIAKNVIDRLNHICRFNGVARAAGKHEYVLQEREEDDLGGYST